MQKAVMKDITSASSALRQASASVKQLAQCRCPRISLVDSGRHLHSFCCRQDAWDRLNALHMTVQVRRAVIALSRTSCIARLAHAACLCARRLGSLHCAVGDRRRIAPILLHQRQRRHGHHEQGSTLTLFSAIRNETFLSIVPQAAPLTLTQPLTLHPRCSKAARRFPPRTRCPTSKTSGRGAYRASAAAHLLMLVSRD